MSKAADFWKTRKEYPPVTCNYRRRFIDLGIVLDYTDGVRSISDVGCGEGNMLLMLRELTDIDKYYAYDISQVFIDRLIARWGDCPGLSASVVDITEFTFPEVDLCTCMGSMLYIEDDPLMSMLSKIKANTFICRMPCSPDVRLTIDKFSHEFNAHYFATYRTVSEYSSILSEHFDVKAVGRCYPDDIESKYNSKQYLFVCQRKAQ